MQSLQLSIFESGRSTWSKINWVTLATVPQKNAMSIINMTIIIIADVNTQQHGVCQMVL